MKVALIIERADADLGGAERSLFELSAALKSAGCEVEILAAKGNTKIKNARLLCSQLPGKRTKLAHFEKAIREQLTQNRYDIIHSFLPFDFADVYQPRGGAYPEAVERNAASYSNSLVRKFKKATAYLNSRRAELAAAERRICTSETGPVIAALSDYVAEQFKKHYGIWDNRIVLVRNGVLTDRAPAQKDKDSLRTDILGKFSLKEADEPLLLLFAANNFRLKGLAELIKAIQMSAAGPNRRAYLVVAGAGKPAAYRRLAAKLNVDSKILFLGPVRKIEIPLGVCDLAALPTYYDPSSRFILEALAADKPVITTKYNGATDLFVNNRHGKVIDVPENIPALAEAISYFTNTKNLIRASTAIIKDNLREQISISRAARELIQLYEKIISVRKSK